MRTGLTVSILCVSQLALAAGSAGHGDGEIPWQLIGYQAVNVGIIFVALAYFLRSKVRVFFADKKATYIAAAEKSLSARRSAEQEKEQLQVRLSKLQSTAEESVQRARAEAADMRNAMIAEARALSEKIRKEAEAAARLEVEKAKNQLRSKLIHESLTLARSQIGQKVSADDHKRLQDNFISNIQAVR